MWKRQKRQKDILRGDYGRRIKNEKLPRPTPVSTVGSVMYIPMLFIIVLNIIMDLALYFAIRQLVNLWEYLFVWRGKRLTLRKRLRQAANYSEWKEAAQALDKYLENDLWKKQPQSAFFDWELIADFVKSAETAMAADLPSVVVRLLLQGGLKPNFAGVESEHLYSQCYYGTKQLIDEYIATLDRALLYIQEHESVTTAEKQSVFKAGSRQYGRSALCLSGGASFGYFHLGVIKTLAEHDALPTVVTGTSAGSLMAALIGCWTSEELAKELNASFYKHLTACADSWLTRFRRWYKTGAMFDQQDWYHKALFFTKGSLTFKEAFERTGRALNITVVPDHPGAPAKLLNYLIAPDVVIASAILASSAVPHFLLPVELLMKQADGTIVPYMGSGKLWRDGSLRTDIPTTTLDSLYNVKFSIVSQVNPHVVLFFFDNKGSSGHPVAHRRGRGWRGGFVLAFLELLLKLDLQKLLKLLKDLDLLPSIFSLVFLQRFHGSVTILPRIKLWHYFRILEDPGSETIMDDYMSIGERRTWPKLYMIKNRLRVEKSLARGRHAVKSLVKASPPKSKLEASRSTSVSKALSETENPSLQNSSNDLVSMLRDTEMPGLSDDEASPCETPTKPFGQAVKQTLFSRSNIFSAGEEFDLLSNARLSKGQKSRRQLPLDSEVQTLKSAANSPEG